MPCCKYLNVTVGHLIGCNMFSYPCDSEREDAAKSRKDARLKNIIISEKTDKKSAKYMANQAPFPHSSTEAYNRSLRHPIGQEYNTMKAFREFTMPPVSQCLNVSETHSYSIHGLEFWGAHNIEHKSKMIESWSKGIFPVVRKRLSCRAVLFLERLPGRC